MFTFERYTERRGRLAVPAILRRTRLRRFSLWARCGITAIDPPLSGLADLAADLLVAVADALALVRLGRTNLPDLRRHLAYLLLVVPADDDRRRVRHLELDALPRRDRHGVRVPDLPGYVPPSERRRG